LNTASRGTGLSAFPAKTENTLPLPDGRTLGWAEFGDPGGKPVLYCHGFPGSRLEAELTNTAAGRHGLRIVAPDRPGYGLSDFQPGRTLASWPADLAHLADALGIDTFAVLGISGGGPYAAACAHKLPRRLTGVGIVCGLGPTDRHLLRQMKAPARWGFGIARHAPALARLLFGGPVGRIMGRKPEAVLRLLSVSAPEADRQALCRPGVRNILTASIREAFRQGGAGAACDLCLFARPWGFDPAQAKAPVRLWHGEQDPTVPAAMGRHLAERIPGCHGEFLAGEGHFSLPIRHMDEILSALKT